MRVDELRDLLARSLNRLFGALAELMCRGCVAESFSEIGKHRGDDGIVYAGGGTVVEINLHDGNLQGVFDERQGGGRCGGDFEGLPQA
jgi:hypothetical protein